MTSGYSGTPLAKKLGIKEGTRILGHNLPVDYLKTLKPLPSDVELLTRLSESAFIHVFVRDAQELTEVLPTYKGLLQKSGMLWISWPKGTELKRDYIREQGLSAGLVDVKIASFNDQWSGLKFVYRLKDRK